MESPVFYSPFFAVILDAATTSSELAKITGGKESDHEQVLLGNSPFTIQYIVDIIRTVSNIRKKDAIKLAYALMVASLMSDSMRMAGMENDKANEILLDPVVDIMECFPEEWMLNIEDELGEITLDAHKPLVSQKIDRNGACPCGSGKKYKKCCL